MYVHPFRLLHRTSIVLQSTINTPTSFFKFPHLVRLPQWHALAIPPSIGNSLRTSVGKVQWGNFGRTSLSLRFFDGKQAIAIKLGWLIVLSIHDLQTQNEWNQTCFSGDIVSRLLECEKLWAGQLWELTITGTWHGALSEGSSLGCSSDKFGKV